MNEEQRAGTVAETLAWQGRHQRRIQEDQQRVQEEQRKVQEELLKVLKQQKEQKITKSSKRNWKSKWSRTRSTLTRRRIFLVREMPLCLRHRKGKWNKPKVHSQVKRLSKTIMSWKLSVEETLWTKSLWWWRLCVRRIQKGEVLSNTHQRRRIPWRQQVSRQSSIQVGHRSTRK